jgi:POT family proton-dependent oligopeptide transporter
MSSAKGIEEKQWFGHPAGLSTLFFTEMWERFSYYGMRALLMLFMTKPALEGGLGWTAGKAGPIYGLYTAMVYMTAVPGGWIADRIIGQRRATFIGGFIIMLGHISLMFHGILTFYLGLCLIIIGTGLLKPNISTMVGQLYTEKDARRDAGFSIFYMGINLGAFLAPLTCGFLAQSTTFKGWLEGWGLDPVNSWHWGFGAAAVGMALGLVQYVLTGHRMGQAGLVPAGRGTDAEFSRNRKMMWGAAGVLLTAAVIGVAANWSALVSSGDAVTLSEAATQKEPLFVTALNWMVLAIPFVYFGYLFLQKGWSDTERKRLYTIPIFFFAAALFWSGFEQAGSTMTIFADDNTANSIFGWMFPSTWWQSANAIFIVILAPFFAALWVRLAKRGKEPSSPAKFSTGLFFLGIGFLVLAFGAMLSGPENHRVSIGWLLSVYLLHTIGELCLSPVGLSTMTKLAPARITGQMMGVWFMAAAVGNSIGGQVASVLDQFAMPKIFGAVFLTSLAAALVMAVLVKPVKRLMSGVN